MACLHIAKEAATRNKITVDADASAALSSSGSSFRRMSWKIHVVAALVLFHVIANLLDALPDATLGL